MGDYECRTLAGEQDELPIYRKRLRLADELNARHGRPLQYLGGGWISYVIMTAHPSPSGGHHSRIDDGHNVMRRLKSVADVILLWVHSEFQQLDRSRS